MVWLLLSWVFAPDMVTASPTLKMESQSAPEA